MQYKPGTHLIATLQVPDAGWLTQYAACKSMIDKLVEDYSLQKLGEVYHNFQPAGFTAVICLSESHISIHTWPEFNKLNIDIYLSNYERTNDGTVVAIYQAIKQELSANAEQETLLKR